MRKDTITTYIVIDSFCDHCRQLEEDYVAYTADVERRTTEVAAAKGEMRSDAPLCPICLESELVVQEGKMTVGQNVCADCCNLTCLRCGNMEQSVTSKVCTRSNPEASITSMRILKTCMNNFKFKLIWPTPSLRPGAYDL